MTMVAVGTAVAAMVLLSCLSGGQALEGLCKCTASGDPHYRTFDGARLDITEDCKYRMSEFKLKNYNCYFRVEIKHVLHPTSSHPKRAFPLLVDVCFRDGTYIRLQKGGGVTMQGQVQTLPFKTSFAKVTRAGGKVRVMTICGVKVTYDGKSRVTVTAPKRYGNKVTGLCGNCDGDPKDDRSVQGQPFSSFPDQDSAFKALGRANIVFDDTDSPSDNKRQRHHFYHFAVHTTTTKNSNRKK